MESIRRTFSQSDFDRFAALSGDDNPIHVDLEFAARSKFGRTVAHGMFLYGCVCRMLGTPIPDWDGDGVQIEQELMFPSPTFVGEEVEIRVEGIPHESDEIISERLATIVRPDGGLGLKGSTFVHMPHTVTPPETGFPASDCQEFKGMKLGQRAETRRAFTVDDMAEYVSLTEDAVPFFTDAAYARSIGLEGALVPPALLGGLFSYLLGTRLPGPGTNYLKQRLRFPSPAYADQELSARVEIIRLRPEKQLINLSTICAEPSGRIVCSGEALVLVSDV